MSKYCSSIGVSFTIGRRSRGRRKVSLYRLSNLEQRAIARAQLDDDSIAQRAVRHAIAQHDPPILRPALSARRVRHVHDLVAAVLRRRRPENREGASPRIIIEDAAA